MQRDLYYIIKQLRDRERGINPDPAWVRATRDTLLMQVANTMPTTEADAIRRRRPVALATLYGRIVRALRAPAVVTLSISTVALGGSIASVSAAEWALPGDTLYSVKLVTEQARLALTSSKHDKVKLKAEFTKRRVEELRTIVNTPVTKKEERAAQAADILKRDLDTLKQQLTDVQQEASGSDAADAAKTVDKNAMEVVKALNETKKDLSPEVKEKVTAAQAQAADVGIQALEMLVGARAGARAGASALGVSASDLDSSLAAHAEMAAASVAETKALSGSATSSFISPLPPTGSATTTLQLVQAAEQSLSAAQKSVQENKLDEAVGLIKDATTKSFTAQKQVEQEALALANASGTSEDTLQVGLSTNIRTASSSTATVTGSVTSSMNGVSPSTSTSMTTSTKGS